MVFSCQADHWKYFKIQFTHTYTLVMPYTPVSMFGALNCRLSCSHVLSLSFERICSCAVVPCSPHPGWVCGEQAIHSLDLCFRGLSPQPSTHNSLTYGLHVLLLRYILSLMMPFCLVYSIVTTYAAYPFWKICKCSPSVFPAGIESRNQSLCLSICSSCLQCAHGCTDNHQWIILIVKLCTIFSNCYTVDYKSSLPGRKKCFWQNWAAKFSRLINWIFFSSFCILFITRYGRFASWLRISTH